MLNSTLSWQDYTVIIVFISILIGISFFINRRKSVGEFLFAGGNMPWLAVGLSIIATSVSAGTFLGNPAYSYQNDLSLLMLNAGSLMSIIVIAIIFIPRFQKLQVQSAYEVLESSFGRPVRLLAATLYTGHLLLRTGILIYGPSLVLSMLFGVNPYYSVFFTAAAAILYTYNGGIRGVIWTDVMQFVILIAGGLFALWFCAEKIGGLGELWSLAAAEGKTQIFSMEFDPSSARNIYSASIVYLFYEVAIRGCDQQFIQRYMSCKNAREATYSSVFAAFTGVGVGLLFYTIGIGLFVLFTVKKSELLPPDIKVDEIFPYFIGHYMPAGFKGLLVAAIYSDALSSLNSSLTALTNTTVVDFYGQHKDANALQKAKKWTIVWGLVGCISAVICVTEDKALLEKALFFTSLFTGPLLGIFLFCFYRPMTSPKAIFAGVFNGMIFLLFCKKDIPVISQFAEIPNLYPFHPLWFPFLSLTVMSIVVMIMEWLFNPRSN